MPLLIGPQMTMVIASLSGRLTSDESVKPIRIIGDIPVKDRIQRISYYKGAEKPYSENLKRNFGRK